MDPLVVLAAVTVIFLAVIVPAAVFWHGRMSPRARMRHGSIAKCGRRYYSATIRS
jgi:hypothetical protein